MSELFSIKGKVALVTGGSRGIGLMIARGFVEAGAKVYISSRKQEVCDQVARALSKEGTCHSLPADLSDEAEIERLIGEMQARESELHLLVNNAGANWGAPFEEYPASAFDKLFTLNVKAAFLLTRGLVPLLAQAASPKDPARVINVGSADGIRPPALETYAYGASKAGLHHLTRHMARRLSTQQITVNAIAPGPFESKMMESTLEKLREQVIAAVPLKRIGEPDDMAGIAIYLASRAGSYVTGAIISVDGGMATCG